jgi:hypothetical protein
VEPSHEYASSIVNSVVTGEPSVIYGNVLNRGLIPQLPEGCAVEVPTLVDENGLQPTVVRDIPPQLVALMRTNINVQDLTVQALLTENREHVYHAAMLDPHTGAELDLDQIWSLVDDLLEATGRGCPSGCAPSRGGRRRDGLARPHLRRGRRDRRLARGHDADRRRGEEVARHDRDGRGVLAHRGDRRGRGVHGRLPPDAPPLRASRGGVPAGDGRHHQVRHPSPRLAAAGPPLRRAHRRPALVVPGVPLDCYAVAAGKPVQRRTSSST